MFALSVANVCLVCGKFLPCLWQMFALSVANVCLVCGKCLPCLWQMFALSVANVCLVYGLRAPSKVDLLASLVVVGSKFETSHTQSVLVLVLRTPPPLHILSFGV